eukprot:5234298-Pyramimonas_sp.AAC.1
MLRSSRTLAGRVAIRVRRTGYACHCTSLSLMDCVAIAIALRDLRVCRCTRVRYPEHATPMGLAQ